MPAPALSKKVLVVEDDMAIAGLLTRSLQNEGFEVVAVHDGESGLVKCVEFRPDVLLLDVNLPKLDGFSVAKRLKATDALKNIPIIFLTAKDRPTDMIQGIQAGAKHYLTKPFKLDELISKVRKLAGV
jgi:DNA-binding response OmpR family regulator